MATAAKKTATTLAERQAAKENKATYEVTSPLNHDGTEYAIGDEVALTDAEAAPLLAHTVKAKAKAD